MKRLYYIGGVVLVMAAVGAVSFFIIVKDLPGADILTSRQVLESTKIYDRTGETLLYEIHGEEKRTVIPFREIPEIVKQATLAIEDENFYTHSAFDWKSILRAFLVNLTKGKISQGGSTITQQLAKKAYLTDARVWTRKIKELVLAIRLEKRFTKDEIFSLYLNQIPYGSNAYGIEAAAQTFFNKKARNLNLPEAALLASLPNRPSYYSPYGNHAEEMLARKNLVLDKMFGLGYIDEKQRDKAEKYKFDFAPNFTSIKAPHFALMVQDYLNNKYGEDFVRTAGLRVITSLDWNLQQLAEKTVLEGAERNKELYAGHNSALVAQDANTGQILSLVGSRDYFAKAEPENCQSGLDCKFEGNFNVAIQGLRQPGSAIKPFAYVTAFKKGFTPDTIVFDTPTEFAHDNPDCPLIVDFSKPEKEDTSCFHPHNFDEMFRGPVTLKQALGQSINVPAAKVLYLAGIDNVLKLVKLFGINTLTERSRYGLSLVLGGGEVKLSELVGAYSVFAQEGIKHQQSFILKITDNQNKTLEEYADDPVIVIEPQYTRLINDILSDSENRVPLFQNSLALTVFPNQEVALKTGTTNDYRDAWAIGYNRSLVVGVWAGNNDNTSMQKRGTSILAAVPIWSAFMREALKGRPTETFTQPETISTDKPMLKGEYVVNYWLGTEKLPQVHDLLFYVDKNDPRGPVPADAESDSQFQNWEEPTIAWAKTHIPNFEQQYNKPISLDAELKTGTSDLEININSPANGSFIQNQFFMSFDLQSKINIRKLEIYFNNILIDTLPNLGTAYSYRKNLQVSNVFAQNLLKISAVDDLNNKIEKNLILYK